jgi:hypothetical protein
MEGKDERFQEDLISLTQLISQLLSRHCGRRFVDDSFFVANCKQHTMISRLYLDGKFIPPQIMCDKYSHG